MKVRVTEDWRRFDVHLGDKKVGRIEGSNDYYAAYIWDAADGSWSKDVGSYETIRRAMQAIFQSLGYGKCGRGFKVKFAEVQ
jgi:hypothetical protein